MEYQNTLAILMNKVNKSYGSKRGVTDLNLTVKKGEIVGFIGPNGAGKSTTIRLLMQMISPTSGDISILGERIKKDHPMIRSRIGYLPSEIRLYPDLTGKQMLELAAGIHGVDLKKTRIPEFAQRLQWEMNPRIRTYSLGNRKKLGILLALLHKPELLILDEPTSGLDPLAQQSFFEIVQELNETNGTTVFLSTHILTEVDKVCHRVVFIRDGKIIQDSSVPELTKGGAHLYEVTFKESGDLRQTYGLLNIDPHSKYRDGACSGRVEDGCLNKLLSILADKPIKDLSLRKLSLEERFMENYSRNKEKKVEEPNDEQVV
ncbi:ABC transporter ATP-binding protein [Paenibacillus sp. GCM10027626]|uniref:ABC transporter ATP-binding protein n=1 Tax=Paenibacillus sp. GCM10027626 TaxID=3273411 RepID=UPI0036342722